ncbi:hypothetical protein HYFRA_00005441 [Hymenoscyphus fraxineus]|uniref:Autophagy-related protein 9 n=1 Tax=Hymenoscyphus fraxineus TaxID=746836 RepID=A0A9N9KQP3_9HELO|nr:hypothetical protein HYFRA_00005441 [Hymenoscyphus fraxineus]
MMRSNLFSRLLPNPNHRSIYEELRAEEDLEDQRGLDLDEENLRFHDDQLGDDHDLFNGDDSTTEDTAFLSGGRNPSRGRAGDNKDGLSAMNLLPQSPRLLEDDGDDDVPQSLLIEANPMAGPSVPPHSRPRPTKNKRQPPIPGPGSRENRAHWEAALAQQQIHQERSRNEERETEHPPRGRLFTGSEKQKALWRWSQVTDIDGFIHEVYDYYLGCGFSCIILKSSLNILRQIFMACLFILLTQCIDYTKFREKKKLSEVIIPNWRTRMSTTANVFIWVFALALFFQVYKLLTYSIPRMKRTRDFYTHLLGIQESHMQTVTWQDVVARIMAMRDANPTLAGNIITPNIKYMDRGSKQRLDAHDIANRLMRRENYLIAMFNKEVLDLNIAGQTLFSRHLLFNLDMAIMDYIFTRHGQISQVVLTPKKRKELSDGLKRRFALIGLGNAILAPGLVLFYSVLFFLRYFNEFQQKPSSIGQRSYTPLAEWKFREFNELQHIFEERIKMSRPYATHYLDQFPKVKTIHLATFLTFISGAILAVLGVAALWHSELFLEFEIIPNVNGAICIAIVGAIWKMSSGTVPEPDSVFDPAYAMQNVISYTHYKPPDWEGRLETEAVQLEFASLYKTKIMLFLSEMLCIIATPYILYFNLPNCSDRIIDFFREFTVDIDGIGYVCSFAVFDFKMKDGRKANPGPAGAADPREDYYSTKQGKMTASYYGFIDNYIHNPKSGLPGHMPPNLRTHFNPPPSFPGMMSPTFNPGMQSSAAGVTERRTGARGPAGLAHAGRTPRFAPVGAQGSPMTSILLDPHHQPSSSGFGGGARSTHRPSRSRYQAGARSNIEEQTEDEDERITRRRVLKKGKNANEGFVDESVASLGESRWETSPVRGLTGDGDEEGDVDNGGVLGLLQQLQQRAGALGGDGRVI